MMDWVQCSKILPSFTSIVKNNINNNLGLVTKTSMTSGGWMSSRIISAAVRNTGLFCYALYICHNLMDEC